MYKKINLLSGVFLLVIYAHSGLAQGYSKINKDLDKFRKDLDELKIVKDQGKRNDLLKELEKDNAIIKASAEKDELINSNTKLEYPFSYYYVSTRLYLLLCEYNETMYATGNSCSYLVKLIQSLTNISGSQKELPFMNESYIKNKISRLKDKDRKEYTEKMKLNDEDVMTIYKEGVKKIKELCENTECKLPTNLKRNCGSILANIAEEDRKAAASKVADEVKNNEDSQIDRAKIDYYLSRSAPGSLEKIYENIKKDAKRKYPNLEPHLELKVTSFGIYGENKELDFTMWVNKNMMYTSERKGYGLGKYRDSITDLALAIIVKTLSEIYDTLKISQNKVYTEITGYADGIPVGDTLFYYGDLELIKDVKYRSIPDNAWLVANFKKHTKIRNNVEIGFFRAYYPYKYLMDLNLISNTENKTKLVADTSSSEGPNLRKVKIVVDLYDANKNELDMTNFEERKEIMKIINTDGELIPLIPFSNIPDKNPLCLLPIDNKQELVPLKFDILLEGGKEVLIKKVLNYFKDLNYDQFVSSNRVIMKSDFFAVQSNDKNFVEGFAFEILASEENNRYILNCYPLYRTHIEDGKLLLYHYPGKEQDILKYLKQCCQNFYSQTFK